jgi:hypothetical protein
MDAVQDVTQARAALPFDVVSDVPCLQSGEPATGSTLGVYPKTRSCERTEDKFVSRETKVVWDSLRVAEPYELFDGTRVTTNSSLSPTVSNCLIDTVLGPCRQQMRVVVGVKEGAPPK